MFTAICIVAVVAGATLIRGQVPVGKCSCLPDQFHMEMVVLAQTTRPVFPYTFYAIDYNIKKMATVTYMLNTTSNTKTTRQRIVLDFNDGVDTSYRITSTSCTNTTSNSKPYQCIPGNAYHFGSTYLGFYVGGLTADYYRFIMPGSNVMLTLVVHTQELLSGNRICVPIVQVVSPASDTSHATPMLFNGFKPYIEDRSVFDVPSNCF